MRDSFSVGFIKYKKLSPSIFQQYNNERFDLYLYKVPTFDTGTLPCGPTGTEEVSIV
jgi:hypothetical protein